MFHKLRVRGILIVVILGFVLSFTGCLGGGGTVAFKLQGVRDGGTYGRPVAALVTPAEGSAIKQLTLNGKAYENGTPIVASGNYKLGIVVEDDKGKSVVDGISFTLDIQTFKIGEDLQGFSGSHSSLAYNLHEDFLLKYGSPSSIRVIPEENEWNNLARVRFGLNHNDWVTDWTSYDTISVWVYLSELESLEGKGVRIGIYGNITETYYGPANSISFRREGLVAGWNNLRVDLEELLVFESSWDSEEHSVSIGDIIDRRGELANFRSSMFIEADSLEPFYVSDIQLLRK